MTALANRPPAQLLPSFFMGGFESATPINKERVRIDGIALTRHDLLVRSDYRRLRSRGMTAARDGIRWNLIDSKGRLDFASATPFVDAAEEERITVIWDLFHYGYPDDLDPFREPFVERFAAYARSFARMLVKRGHCELDRGGIGTRFYTPVNEISFFAWAGGEQGIFAPHATNRGPELKRRLVEAAVAGIDAIREADPLARFVNCDPVVRVVAPRDAPWLRFDADHFNRNCVCEAWDMLAGRCTPEIGGSPAHLDILGVNYYGVNQWEHLRPDNVLAEDDPRRTPFSELLADLHDRYEHPIIVTETASNGSDRRSWLLRIGSECLRAMQMGVDLHGVCVYPVVGMADWETGQFRPMGLWDRSPRSSDWRVPVEPCLAALDELQASVSRAATHATAQSALEPLAA